MKSTGGAAILAKCNRNHFRGKFALALLYELLGNIVARLYKSRFSDG
jgi:hypothetical protein